MKAPKPRDPFLDELDRAFTAISAEVLTGEEAHAQGLPRHPNQQRLCTICRYHGHYIGIRLAAGMEMPFCNVSVRTVEAEQWGTTYFVTRTPEDVVTRIKEVCDGLPRTRRRSR